MRFLRELVENRTLLLELVRRDVRGRFAGARFGLLWSLLNPAIQLLSYGLIFGFLYGASDPTRRSVLVASLFCGLFPWWAFQEGATRGMTALVDQSALLRRIPMPPFLCVCAATISSFLLQMIGFLLFLGAFSLAGLVGTGLALVTCRDGAFACVVVESRSGSGTHLSGPSRYDVGGHRADDSGFFRVARSL